MDNSSLLRRLALLKANPKLAESLPQSDILAFVSELLGAFNSLKTAIERNKLRGEKGDKGEPGKNARELIAGVDYLTKQQSDALLERLEDSYNRLSLDLEARLSALKDGKDGKDAVVTPEMLQAVSQMAVDLIALPDFEALFATVVQTNPAIVRDGLELLPDGEKLSQDAIADLPQTLRRIEDTARRSQSGAGGIGTGQVNKIFDQRIPVSATAPVQPAINQLWVDIS